jgi:hypothetical protein
VGDRLDKAVQGVRALFEDLNVDVKEERLIRFILNELQKGRSFDEVMSDPYVVNRTNAEARARMLENPAILEGIEDQLAGELFFYKVDFSRPAGGTEPKG